MPKVPWDKDQYFIEDKTIWLMGSFMRAMAIRDRKDKVVPGYTIKLCTYSELMEKKNAKET